MERKHIKASEGMMLTNGDVYALEVDLGNWDSPENWREIPIAEYEEKMRGEDPI
jgi:hypothetical protein